MTTERWRWWLSTFETTQDEELDCDAVFELLETVVEAVNAGQDLSEFFPAIAVHLAHCPDCRDLFDTLVELLRTSAG